MHTLSRSKKNKKFNKLSSALTRIHIQGTNALPPAEKRDRKKRGGEGNGKNDQKRAEKKKRFQNDLPPSRREIKKKPKKNEDILI